ncbi:8045_t:CDS:2 [Funneliformis geosporum]|nr:8045_t:CDS:2 [Funneliformis geosporum]
MNDFYENDLLELFDADIKSDKPDDNKYISKKRVDPTFNHNKESAQIECGFLINTLYCKLSNLVFINKFVSDHNYALQDMTLFQEFSPVIQKIPDNIMEEIQFYVKECNLELLEYLINLHAEDSEWYFKVKFEGANRLFKIFGMSQEQKKDVISIL